MLTDIRNALTRKFGPLPAWAWLGILGVGAYLYRRRSGASNGGATGTGADVTDATTPDIPDPTVLQPGESAYNPATGQLVSGQPAPADTSNAGPVIIGPGETAFDPATGRVISGQPIEPDDTGGAAPPPSAAPGVTKKASALARAKAAVTRGRVGPKNTQRLRDAGYSQSQISFHTKARTKLGLPASRKPKPKPQHASNHTTAVKHPATTKTRTRSTATTRHPVPRTKTTAKNPALARSRSKPAATKPPPRARATTERAPVQRQRPEPAHTTPRKPAPKRKK